MMTSTIVTTFTLICLVADLPNSVQDKQIIATVKTKTIAIHHHFDSVLEGAYDIYGITFIKTKY
jgi:hypothetical protein